MTEIRSGVLGSGYGRPLCQDVHLLARNVQVQADRLGVQVAATRGHVTLTIGESGGRGCWIQRRLVNTICVSNADGIYDLLLCGDGLVPCAGIARIGIHEKLLVDALIDTRAQVLLCHGILGGRLVSCIVLE